MESFNLISNHVLQKNIEITDDGVVYLHLSDKQINELLLLHFGKKIKKNEKVDKLTDMINDYLYDLLNQNKGV